MSRANLVTERTLDSAIRDAQAARLRSEGLTYRDIAESMGYAGVSGAHQAVKRAIRELPREGAEDLRNIERERLDRLYAAAMRIVRAPDLTLSALGIDKALKVMDRRAKMEGLDAPVRSELHLVDSVDATIERLVADMARLDAGAEAAAEGRAAAAEAGQGSAAVASAG